MRGKLRLTGRSQMSSCRMLKKSLFSPAQPWRAKTRLFSGSVLASFRPSTYPEGYASDLHSLRPC